ncbi:hypothetical protein [Nocardioides nanhaiensis]|uniref:hypothetical protein n=1 Tax=Nocardioides nanhaiensis TaxID=1476871 RepID=UPI0031E604AD
METEHELREWPGPDVRPLGFIALGFAVLAVVLGYSLLFSPFAYPVAALGAWLGVAARSEPAARRLGTLAVGLSVTAVVLATVMMVGADHGW